VRKESELTVRKGAHLTVRQTLGLALALTAASTVLGAAGVFGYQLHQAGRQGESLRLKAMAEVYAAQVAQLIGVPASLHEDEPPPSPVSQLCEPSRENGGYGALQARLEEWAWHPASRLLAVLDFDGDIVALRGDRALLQEWIASFGSPALRESGPSDARSTSTSPASAPPVTIIPGNSALCLPEVAMVAVPITPSGAVRPLGTLVYAARTSTPYGPGAGRSVWKYMAAVLAISLAGILMGLCLLWHGLLEPLNALLRIGRTEERPAPSGPGNDEIEALASLLRDMNCGLDEWRERVAELEASVDQRVRDETLKVTRQLRQIEHKAWIDPLSRLSNRRLMDEKYAALFNRCRDAGEELAVVMLDVDHFKTLNDTLGHKAGDELIGFIGELLRQCIRGEDWAIRYGGDEFLLILPGSNSTQAGMVAERIIRLFGQRARLLAVEPRPSMSAGVASLRDHRPATSASLIQMADQALYRAKSLGKSQVSVYRPGAARSAELRRSYENT